LFEIALLDFPPFPQDICYDMTLDYPHGDGVWPLLDPVRITTDVCFVPATIELFCCS